MANRRVIARLDIKGPNLVKGIHLEGLRVLGQPHEFARYYYECGADEIVYSDVVASLYGRNSLCELVKETAQDIFIPMTVGGGIRTLDDIKAVLRAGADKVSINTSAINDPLFVKRASRKLGSSTIVVAIEAIKQPDGRYYAYTDCGREHTGKEVVSWAREIEDLGGGEIVITSVNQEGTGKGFDYELTKEVSNSVSIPVIAHGGAGNIEDVAKVLKSADADAVAVASIIHYEAIQHHELYRNSSEGNFEYLKRSKNVKHLNPATIQEIKQKLCDEKVSIRPFNNEIGG